MAERPAAVHDNYFSWTEGGTSAGPATSSASPETRRRRRTGVPRSVTDLRLMEPAGPRYRAWCAAELLLDQHGWHRARPADRAPYSTAWSAGRRRRMVQRGCHALHYFDPTRGSLRLPAHRKTSRHALTDCRTVAAAAYGSTPATRDAPVRRGPPFWADARCSASGMAPRRAGVSRRAAFRAAPARVAGSPFARGRELAAKAAAWSWRTLPALRTTTLPEGASVRKERRIGLSAMMRSNT